MIGGAIYVTCISAGVVCRSVDRNPVNYNQRTDPKIVLAGEKKPDSVQQTPVAKQTVYLMTATAYCERGITKGGVPAGPGKIAVDPKVIPLGTRVYVQGYGSAVACDTGRLIKGRRIDVWLPSRKAALNWGRRRVTVYVYQTVN